MIRLMASGVRVGCQVPDSLDRISQKGGQRAAVFPTGQLPCQGSQENPASFCSRPLEGEGDSSGVVAASQVGTIRRSPCQCGKGGAPAELSAMDMLGRWRGGWNRSAFPCTALQAMPGQDRTTPLRGVHQQCAPTPQYKHWLLVSGCRIYTCVPRCSQDYLKV